MARGSRSNPTTLPPSPTVTYYVALPFVRLENGALAPGQAVECPHSAAAIRRGVMSGSEMNTGAVATNHAGVPNRSFDIVGAGTFNSRVRQNETLEQGFTDPIAESSSTRPSLAVRGLTAASSESTPVLAGQPTINSASVSSESPSIDPQTNSGSYPPRRIPWHQGFTVEEQWYRTWYGWTALDTQEAATSRQSLSR